MCPNVASTFPKWAARLTHSTCSQKTRQLNKSTHLNVFLQSDTLWAIQGPTCNNTHTGCCSASCYIHSNYWKVVCTISSVCSWITCHRDYVITFCLTHPAAALGLPLPSSHPAPELLFIRVTLLLTLHKDSVITSYHPSPMLVFRVTFQHVAQPGLCCYLFCHPAPELCH